MPMMQSSTELKCFKGLVYFYVVLLSVSVVMSDLFAILIQSASGPITEQRASRRSGLVLAVKLRSTREQKIDTTTSDYTVTKRFTS